MKTIRFGNTIVVEIPKICNEVIVNRNKENFKIQLPDYDFSEEKQNLKKSKLKAK